MAFYPIDYSEPKNTCTFCGKLWEGDPYEYETDSHEFLCPECAAQQRVEPTEEKAARKPEINIGGSR